MQNIFAACILVVYLVRVLPANVLIWLSNIVPAAVCRRIIYMYMYIHVYMYR